MHILFVQFVEVLNAREKTSDNLKILAEHFPTRWLDPMVLQHLCSPIHACPVSVGNV